jgi:hypothetical protein
MAQKITLICDVDHSDSEHEATDVRRVGLGGIWRLMDVCDEGAKIVDTTVMPLMEKGRATAGNLPVAKRPNRGAAGGQALKLNAAIRRWAKTKGLHVAPSGRIPAEIVEAYNLDQQFHGTEVKV